MIHSGEEEQRGHLLRGAHPEHVTQRLHCVGRLDDLAVLSVQRQATQQLCSDGAAVPAPPRAHGSDRCCLHRPEACPPLAHGSALTGCCLQRSCKQQACPCSTLPGVPVVALKHQ